MYDRLWLHRVPTEHLCPDCGDPFDHIDPDVSNLLAHPDDSECREIRFLIPVESDSA